MQKGDLSYRINACAMRVYNQIGPGHMEYIYCRALAIVFRREGISFEREVWLPIYFEGFKIGYRRADFVVEGHYMIEVKAIKALDDASKAQAFSTLKAINRSEASLLNFGAASLEFKHIYNKNVLPEADFNEINPELLGEINDDLFEARHYLPSWVVYKTQMDRRKIQNQHKPAQ